MDVKSQGIGQSENVTGCALIPFFCSHRLFITRQVQPPSGERTPEFDLSPGSEGIVRDWWGEHVLLPSERGHGPAPPMLLFLTGGGFSNF